MSTIEISKVTKKFGEFVAVKDADLSVSAGEVVCLDEAGKLAGIAAEGGAKGYADTVRIMFGYQPDCQCVVGIGVVSMRETPGIGDKILTDKAFLANFTALDLKLKDDLAALANEVKAVKHGTLNPVIVSVTVPKAEAEEAAPAPVVAAPEKGKGAKPKKDEKQNKK